MDYYSEKTRNIANDLFIILLKTPVGSITNIQELPWLPFLKQSRSEVQSEMDNSYWEDELIEVEECFKEIVEKDGRFILDYSASEGTEAYFQEGGRDFLLLRNNRKKQDTAARKFARKEKLYGVSFAFYWNKLCFYEILHDPMICVDLRNPRVYVVVEQDLHVRYSSDEESVAYKEAPREPLTNHPWGQEIYQSYEKKVKECIASEYETEIVSICDESYPKYDATMPKPMMYRALEEAEALGMKVDIVPNIEYQPGGNREGQCDGWEYHPEVISKKNSHRK